jgi:uncharacterized protein YndB with AHSA1/START domain
MTTTKKKNETTIELDPKVPLIRIIREFDAPRDRVFRAHVDPELVVQWLGPRDLVMSLEHWDCRTGGSYRYIHRSGDDAYGFFGSFHTVRAPERIVQTFTFEGFPDGVSLEQMTFDDLPGGRCRTVATSLLDSFEGRDALVASGMEDGVRQGHDRLAELLARG